MSDKAKAAKSSDRADARAAARARAAKMQADAEAAERRRKGMIAGAIVLVVVALVVGIGILVQRGRATSGNVADPGFGAQGVISVPSPSGSEAAVASAPTVRIYADYLCPACKALEDSASGYLAQQQKAGAIKREFVPVAILNRLSQGTNYSTRAASAAYCVAKADPAKFDAYTQAMYASQPAENSAGLTNAQIRDTAKSVIPDNAELDTCILDGTYQGYADKVTEQASKDGLASTPRVTINGTELKPLDTEKSWAEALKRGIAAAAKA